MNLSDLVPYLPIVGAGVTAGTAGFIYRRTRRADLHAQLEALIREHDDNVRRAAASITLWPRDSQKLQELIDETYVLWTREVGNRAAPPWARTLGRMRQTVQAVVLQHFERDYLLACAEKMNIDVMPVVDFSSMSRGDVLSLARRLRKYDRVEFVESFQRAREELSDDVGWIFRL